MLLGAAVAAAAATAGALYWWRCRPPAPEEIERQRRSRLSQVGRIVEGEIIELIEAPAIEARPRTGWLFSRRSAPAPQEPNGGRKLVCYSYSISGVTYQTAQDITGLEERVHLDRLVAGQPASVKYDPSNPSNSILVADDWSGLH